MQTCCNCLETDHGLLKRHQGQHLNNTAIWNALESQYLQCSWLGYNIWKPRQFCRHRKEKKSPKYWFSFVFCQGKQGLPGLPGLQGEPVSILALNTGTSCQIFLSIIAFSITLPYPLLPISFCQNERHKQININRQRQRGRIKRSPEFLHRPSVIKFQN